MESAENTKVVQEAYAAFFRRDIPGLMALIADNVEWIGVYGAGPHVPMSGVRHGKPAIGEFFKQVAENVDFTTFEPKEFITTGDKVVALGHYAANTPAKKSFDSDFAMVFTIQNGKITRFQEFNNATALNEAYRVGAAA